MTVPAAVYTLIFISFLRKAARKATSPGTRSRIPMETRPKFPPGNPAYEMPDMAGLCGINVNDLLECLQDETSSEVDQEILRRLRQ